MSIARKGIWRPMCPDDLSLVSAISDAVHGRYSETLAIYAERLALYPAGCLMFEQGQELVGYLVSHPWRGDKLPGLNMPLGALPAQPDCYYFHDIALLPSARGSGAGSAALAFVEDRARAEGLRNITLIAVNGADSFWAAQGFACADEAAAQGARSYGAGSYVMRRVIDV